MRSRPMSILMLGTCFLLGTPSGWSDDRLPGIVFVADDIFGPKYLQEGISRPGTAHWREGYIYHRATTQIPLERSTTPTRPGRNLYTLIPAAPDGLLTRITHLVDGEVFDPEPSYDGTKILFSMRRGGEDWFNLYEIEVDGSRPRQLTDGPFNDVSGVYLPTGQIVFASDRAGYLEEYHEERTETLWIMRGDGTGIRQLTFNPGTVFDPTVLADGRILFSLWDTFLLNVPGADKHETYLMTIRPDGTEESHFFGLGQYRFFNRERHSGIAFNQAGQMPDGTLLVQSELGPSLFDPTRGFTPTDALWPVFPCTTSLQLGGATHRVHLSPTGSRTTPYPLPDGRFLLSATLPGARDLGIYLADPKTRRMELLFNDPMSAEFDARPIMLRRPLPAILPPKGKFPGWRGPSASGVPVDRKTPGPAPRVAVTGRARFAVVNGRRSDNPNHQRVLHRARYYRVVEALPTAVTTSSHTSLATRVLGVVPIFPDGSAFFEAPADTPLFLEPLDAAGHRIHFDWNYPVTSLPAGAKQHVMEMSYITACPGETKSCNGCHAPQRETGSPPEFAAALVRKPASVGRDITDLFYRRNEFDEYRCQARIGEAPKVVPWLASPDPDLRRRACELLREIDDDARETAPEIAGLLDDASVAVRRAAALALTRMGTPHLVPSLVHALNDPDWQVRFHAATALEAITALKPAKNEGGETSRQFYSRLIHELGGVRQLVQALGQGPKALERFRPQDDHDMPTRWFEAVGRLGAQAPESARRLVRDALDIPLPEPARFEPWVGKRHALEGEPPELAAIRAAGWIRDAASVPRLVPWLARPEYHDHATETALALGRIGTPEAVEALWEAARRDVPNRKPYLNRYVQFGPRPEEYAQLRGLILAGAKPKLDDIPLIVALVPGTFLEKPRYEDRMRPESQRVLLGRLLLENAGVRKDVVALLVGVLRGDPVPTENRLYEQIVAGINLERPFRAHGRPFPSVERIEPEQALWLLGSLTVEPTEVSDSLVAPYLTSENWRERIDAAVLLNRWGFGPETADVLATEAAKPYAFKEIVSIGKGVPDTNFRDKAYLLMALAHHGNNPNRLRHFADPKIRYRDIRYGLAVGLGMRGKPDGMGLLTRLATHDPIGVVRRQARESLRMVQETQRLAGLPVPAVELPKPLSFEAWYPPRGLAWPGPVVEPLPVPAAHTNQLAGLRTHVTAGLDPVKYRDLNNANNQAPGAKRMMIRGADSFDRAVHLLAARYPEAAGQAFRDLIESPYPSAHYLALRELGDGGNPNLDPALINKLDAFAKKADTVGFFWTCRALSRRNVAEALPTLARYATAEPFSGLHGPLGMGFGYPAAHAIAHMAGRMEHPEVQRLLASDNVWLRAGALAGLVEAEAPGIEKLLQSLLNSPQPAVVRDHAMVGLAISTNSRAQ